MMASSLYRIMASVFVLSAAAVGTEARCEGLLPARTDVAGGRSQDSGGDKVQLGVWSGSLQLQTRGGYNSNLFGTETDPTGAGFLVLAPALTVQNDWGREAMDLSVRGTFTRYFDHSTQDTDEYAVRGGGHVKLGEATVQLAASIAEVAEERGTNGTPVSTGPSSMYHSVGQRLEVQHENGPVTLSIGAEHETLRYSDIVGLDGTEVSQGFRDSETWNVAGRASYLPSDKAGLSFFIVFEHANVPIPHNYGTESVNIGGTVAIDTGLVRLTLGGGWLNRNFSNPDFRDFSGWIYDGSLDWYATPLMTFSFRANRGLTNSGVPTVGNVVTSLYSANLAYELLRNLLIGGRLAWRHERFPEIGQTAGSATQEINGEFSFNRFVAIGAYGRFECNHSSVTFTERRYCATLGGLSLTLRR
jgi:hypothetical protein